MGFTDTTSGRQVGLAVGIVSMVLIGSVAPALAAPRVFVAGASLESDAAIAGESTQLNIQLRNTGDSGADTVEITANGTVVFSNRYQVDANGKRTVTEELTFDETGTYDIRVNNKSAGILRVTNALVETTDVRAGGRTLTLHTGRLSYNAERTVSFPGTNDSVAVDSLTFTTRTSKFTRTVDVDTAVENGSVPVPEGDGTNVFGTVQVEQVSSVTDQRIRVAVNESTIQNSSLDRDEVALYTHTDGNYEEIETSSVETTDGRFVYEAETGDTDQLLVGEIGPAFSVRNQTLSTSVSGTEKRIVVSATVTNTGGVAGEYTASLGVDGTIESTESVMLIPGEEQTVTVSHGITTDGSYEITLDGESVGTVVVATGSAETSETRTQSQSGTESPAAPGKDAGDSGEQDSPPLAVPDGSDVGPTEIAIGAGVALIGVILVLLQRW